MRVIIQKDYEKLCKWASEYIVSRINKAKPTKDKPFVLGLPTGSSPLGVYRNLIKSNQEGKVSFENVVTFNMDEYVGLSKEHPESYWSFMWTNLFSHINIKKENVHILNGMAKDLNAECESYEKAIKSFGGINLFLGGIGVDGHLAFNEPFSSLNSVTRQQPLTFDTRVVNSRFFDNDYTKVPKTALTVGIKTVTDSEEVLILINGHNKARALQASVEGPVSHTCTCSALQMHQKAIIVCDEEACDELKVATYKYFKDIEDDEIL